MIIGITAKIGRSVDSLVVVVCFSVVTMALVVVVVIDGLLLLFDGINMPGGRTIATVFMQVVVYDVTFTPYSITY